MPRTSGGDIVVTFPNPILTRKIWRDLRRRHAAAAAIAVTVLLGVLLFVASYDAFRNLELSYQRTHDRLHLADYTITGGDPAAVAAAARSVPGVDGIRVRTQTDVPLLIGDTKLVGRVAGLGEQGDATVDALEVTSGSLPDARHPDQVVMEHHAAQTFDLRPGSRLRIFDGRTWQPVTVSGVARSAEYLWPARSRQEPIADPRSFAVVFAPQSQALRLTGRRQANQTLIEMSPTATVADNDRLLAAVRSIPGVAVEPQADQPSNSVLYEDLDGFSELAVGFPVLFLTAAAVAEYVLLTRLVQFERPVIGTLLALGARRSTVIGHYVGYGLAVTATGAALGVLGGFVVTSAVTAAYTHAVGIPDSMVAHRVSTAVIGCALGLLTGLIATLAPAIAAARTAPAAAMRGDGAQPERVGALARRSRSWTRLPAAARMALRSITRGRRRTLATGAGTVLALVLVLASIGMLTSMGHLLAVQFGQIQREDATVVTIPGADRAGQIAAVPGVAAVERSVLAPVTAAAGTRTYATTLTGLPPGTTMHGFRAPDGHAVDLPHDGLLADKALADRLGVAVGHTIVVTPAFGSPHRVRLSGLVDEPLGSYLYGTDSVVAAIGAADSNGYLLRFAPGADRDRVQAAVSTLPEVVAYTDTHALEGQIDEFLGLFWMFMLIMLVLGAVLAFTVIYVTMTVNLAERRTELATLRAAGVSVRRLTAAIAAENLVATLLAIPIGLVAGIAIAWMFVRSFTSDMFTFHLSLGVLPPLLAVVAVVIAAVLSQVPIMRTIERIDIARVARERAQ
ncbi:ABC transporter permease [Nocardia gamkensis]|uniref:ABC transporter permease n=1 Tax=Nocardia gamkensis TaxID=352869 RepID=UPI0037CB1A21